MDLFLASLASTPDEGPVEAAERKGLGHPDTICDALAEELSRALLRRYLDRFGAPLHHNVDKVLLVGGRARPAFGGGEVKEPIEIFLAGRATLEFKGVRVPVAEIAEQTCRAWLARNLHGLDAQRHVRIHCLVRPGSPELVELFARPGEVPANDTSCGVGFAPLTPLEQLVLGLERSLNDPPARARHPECGEDVKVMGVRRGRRAGVTLACAFIDRHLDSLPAYCAAKRVLAARARKAAAAWHGDLDLDVNAADDEAAAGKNAVSHVGKLYNVTAGLVASDLAAHPEIAAARCHLVSRIGAPVDQPASVEAALGADAGSVAGMQGQAEAVVGEHLARLARECAALVTPPGHRAPAR